MSLETGEYIGNMVATNPTPSDPKSQGDDHLRLIKSALQNSFAGIAGMILVSGTESGSGNAYSVALSGEPTTPTAYTASMVVLFQATHANTGNCSLAVAGIASASLLDVNGNQIPSGGIALNSLCAAIYVGTNFYLISPNGVFNVPTPATTDNSTHIATTAFAVQLAFTAALPAQAGNAGKFVTTNGTTASWSNAGIGTVAATVTASATLTGSFEFVNVAMTATAQSVTLPNATGLSLGGPLYAIKNTGAYAFNILDNSGGFVTTVPIDVTVVLFLTANGTPAGTWDVGSGGYPVGQITPTTVLDPTPPHLNIKFVQLSSTTYAVFYSLQSATNTINVVIFTVAGNTITVGTPVAVTTTDSGDGYAVGVLSSTSIIFINQMTGAVSTINAAIITVTGTAASVGATNALAVGGGAGTSYPVNIGNWLFNNVAVFSATQVMLSVYNSTTSGTIYAALLGISGTTVTLQQSTQLISSTSTNVASTYLVSSTTALLVYGVGGGQYYATVATVSGATFTLGTQYTIPIPPTYIFPLSSTTYVVNAAGQFYCVSVSGSVVTSGSTFNNSAYYLNYGGLAISPTSFVVIATTSTNSQTSFTYYTISGTTATQVGLEAFPYTSVLAIHLTSYSSCIPFVSTFGLSNIYFRSGDSAYLSPPNNTAAIQILATFGVSSNLSVAFGYSNSAYPSAVLIGVGQ